MTDHETYFIVGWMVGLMVGSLFTSLYHYYKEKSEK
jgi:hypothetical protein